jgi:predicted metal-binding protein
MQGRLAEWGTTFGGERKERGMSKIRVAIMVRVETTEKCIGKGCLRSFFAKSEAFARYAADEIELVGFLHNGGDLEHKIATMKSLGVDVVHLSTCMRGREPRYAEIAARLSKDFTVIGYTHGPAQGKLSPTIDLNKGELG